MPSPPFCITFCASSALPMLPYTRFLTPDFVTVSFEKYSPKLSFSLRYAACLSLYSLSSASVGSVNTLPLKPSAISISPSEIFSTALTTDKTAGIPIARARIALWLVTPPTSVMIAETLSLFICEVMDGVKSLAMRTEPLGTAEMSTLLTPKSRRKRLSLMSLTSEAR